MFQVGDLQSKSLETFDILSPNYELHYQLSLCWSGFSFLALSLSSSSANSANGARAMLLCTYSPANLSHGGQDNPERSEAIGSAAAWPPASSLGASRSGEQSRFCTMLSHARKSEDLACVGKNHPFFTRKMLFLRSLFPPGWSLCLVILPQEAPWGVQPVEINHPAQSPELLFPSSQGEERIFSLCFSPRLYHNRREGDNIKGISIRKPVSLGSSCAAAKGFQKTLQIWSLLRSPRLPSGVAFLSPLTPERPLRNWPPKSA